MSSDDESKRRERIRRQIRSLQSRVKTYKAYKEDFEDGKGKFEKAYNGVVHLKGTQYNKVTSNCEEAIGNEEELLDALQVKNINMDKLIGDILDEVKNGITAVQNKIDDLNDEISYLESLL